ncbi:MAG: hypothetical protein ACLTZT_13935 [Butyricimonas faecalis]
MPSLNGYDINDYAPVSGKNGVSAKGKRQRHCHSD